MYKSNATSAVSQVWVHLVVIVNNVRKQFKEWLWRMIKVHVGGSSGRC